MSVKIKLSKPVTSEGVEIDSLDIREPIGEDVIACGYPFRVYVGSSTDVDKADKGEQEVKVDSTVMGKLAARLADVPPSTIKRLSISDFQTVVGVVMGFFGQSDQGSSDTEKK